MTRRRSPSPTTVRCAIYTRKSTEDGLEQDFNSLDAQRESAEAYIASQAGEGWVCLPERYDDGGYSGGNVERPALKRLMAAIEAGAVDCIIVYKVDRLSRSLLDFARMVEVFDQHGISFVSVTQQINTASSAGRLMLNVLLSFAQFEREIISERTRDKIAAARRKGKWAGGHPVLGYDVDPQKFTLGVNEDEAAQIRGIFALYLEHEALIPTVRALDERGWTTKRWTTRKGKERGGRPFDKNSLHKLLTNVVYLGKVKYKDEVHEGEHPRIIDTETWERVQGVLARNSRTGGAQVRNKYGALLKGILRCAPCDCSMGHTYSSKGPKRYRYYVCLNAQKRGWHSCVSKSVPAEEIERLVVDQIRAIGRDPSLVVATIRQARQLANEQIKRLETENTRLHKELRGSHDEIRKVVAEPATDNGATVCRLGDLNERIRHAEQRITEVADETTALRRQMVGEREATEALAAFDPVWETLTPKEQARIVQLLVERVDYDGERGRIAMTFRAAGLRALGEEPIGEEAAA